MKSKKTLELPDTQQLEAALHKRNTRSRAAKVLRSTLVTLITVSAAAVLVATLWLPVFRISGSSMNPNLEEGQIVVAMKNSGFKTGDLIAFYYNNKILVKRVIAQAGDYVDISADGTVSVNSIILNEPYVQDLAFGDCNIDLPYQVPESRVFVMGDHRSVSIDSRNTAVGCVADEQIVGKLVFRVWPFNQFGALQAETRK